MSNQAAAKKPTANLIFFEQIFDKLPVLAVESSTSLVAKELSFLDARRPSSHESTIFLCASS